MRQRGKKNPLGKAVFAHCGATTQHELAQQTGLSDATISNMLREDKDPGWINLRSIKALADQTTCTPGELVDIALGIEQETRSDLRMRLSEIEKLAKGYV